MIATIWKGYHPIVRGKKVWIITHKNRKTKDIVNKGSDAFRYWLWALGVNPKIAFGWFRKDRSKIKKKKMFSVKEITEKILIYFRKHSKRYKQAYEAYLAIQGASTLIQLGSQTFLCVALMQALRLKHTEDTVKYIPEFNFKWICENMPEDYKPNHPTLYEHHILGYNLWPGGLSNDSNYVWWLRGDQEWCKKARLKALEVLAEHYRSKLQQILQGKKV